MMAAAQHFIDCSLFDQTIDTLVSMTIVIFLILALARITWIALNRHVQESDNLREVSAAYWGGQRRGRFIVSLDAALPPPLSYDCSNLTKSAPNPAAMTTFLSFESTIMRVSPIQTL